MCNDIYSLWDCLSALLVAELSLGSEPLVQPTELPEEAVVWADLPFVPHRGHSGVNVHVAAKHQVGYDQGGRAAVAFPAMNVHFTCRGGEEQRRSRHCIAICWCC